LALDENLKTQINETLGSSGPGKKKKFDDEVIAPID
jgi:hypothetical protein